MTSPHRRRRRRRADFNLKCSCFCKSLFASLSQLSTFPPSLSLSLNLLLSDCICCVCKSVLHTDTSRLRPLTAVRPQNSCYCLAFEFFSLSLSANFANLREEEELGERVLFYELIKTLTTNSKVYMQSILASPSAPPPLWSV